MSSVQPPFPAPQPIYPLPQGPSVPPPVFAPAQPPIYPGVPPAVAARQRKDQKRDTQRKVGSQVMKGNLAGLPGAIGKPSAGLLPQGSPPPKQPQNSTGDQAPQYTAPTFNQPQYKQPSKGLEYLALGLGLLFPGSGISKLAAGFAGGLNKGSEQAYQRKEQQAQDAYKTAQDQAQGNFENAKIKYEADQQLRSSGIDPKTNKPFVLPPPLMQPPKGANAQQLFQWYSQRAQFYTGVGAKDVAAQQTAVAQDYQRQVIQDATIAAQWQRDLFNQGEQDRRDSFNQGRQDAREGSREAAEDAREDRREAAEDARQDRREAAANYQKLPEIKDKASQAKKEFFTELGKAYKPPTDQNGDAKQDRYGNNLPPTIPAQMQGPLNKTFSLIDRSSDPAGAADHYEETLQTVLGGMTAEQSAAIKGLLTQRGEMASLNRRAQGLPIVPVRYAPIQKPKSSGRQAMGSYEIGQSYQGKTYLGGDPDDPNSWKQ